MRVRDSADAAVESGANHAEDPHMRRLAVPLVVLGLVAASCGGGDDSEAIAAAIADQMMDDADEDSAFDREQAECFGSEVVERVGVDRLEALGLGLADIEAGAEPASVDLAPGDLDDMTNAMTACINFGRLVIDPLVAQFDVGEASADCVADRINEANFAREMAESSFRGVDIPPELETQLENSLFAFIAECFTVEEKAALGF